MDFLPILKAWRLFDFYFNEFLQVEIAFRRDPCTPFYKIVIPPLIQFDPAEFMEKTTPNFTGINPFCEANAGRKTRVCQRNLST